MVLLMSAGTATIMGNVEARYLKVLLKPPLLQAMLQLM